jgi:hypothetical protein
MKTYHCLLRTIFFFWFCFTGTSTVHALTSGGFNYTVANFAASITSFNGVGDVVVIPSSIDGYPVTSIVGGYNTWGRNPTSLTIPNSVTRIGDLAFSGCSTLTSVTIGSGVNSIGVQAFYGCTGLTSMTIPSSVTSIGKNAFDSCSGLTSMTIPSSVSNIASGMFEDCSGLTNLTIPNSVTSIGWGAFRGCRSLRSITIPSRVTSIEELTFFGCIGLTSVTIPDGVTIIGLAAFYNCISLNNLTIPNRVTSIGEQAFFGCRSLASVVIPDSITSIEDGTFSGCNGLRSFAIPSALIRIGANAFYGCSGLTSLVIPSSVTSIGANAFFLCPITSITIPSGVTRIEEGTFDHCSSLKNVTIPNSVTSIGNYAFYCCTGLTSVTIPSSVTRIGDCAFNGCFSLTSITIPSSVTDIGLATFYQCFSLNDIVFMGNAPKYSTNFVFTTPFPSVAEDATVTYPSAATGWGDTYGGLKTVGKATPTITAAPVALAISFGQTLASSFLSGGVGSVVGTFAFITPSTTPSVGTTLQEYTFTPSDSSNYMPMTRMVSVTVIKAIPTITTQPASSAITYGQTLASSSLSGGVGSVTGSFVFTTPSTTPNAGVVSQEYTFTPTDSTNYNLVTGRVNVTVNKATPVITMAPIASAITYGQTLVSSTLSGGLGSVPGVFVFTTPSVAPSADMTSQGYTFKPTDLANYNTVTGVVSVRVNPLSFRIGEQAQSDFTKFGISGTMKLVGALPTGLTFNALTGILSGKITGKAGSYPLTLQFLTGKTVTRSIAQGGCLVS